MLPSHHFTMRFTVKLIFLLSAMTLFTSSCTLLGGGSDQEDPIATQAPVETEAIDTDESSNSESITGTWTLVGSISINGEIAFVGNEPDPNGIEDWLAGAGKELLEEIASTSGLTLKINADGTFTETKDGDPDITWFDQEGVLMSDIVPFNGFVKTNELGSFLQPETIPSWATPADEYNVIPRYDDGDTVISDHIYLNAGSLVRTVNGVTDGLYLDRVVIVYTKS
ncbi:MAG: hypothetical protein AB8G95_23945 [Anaerolineae bacterium]